MAYTTIKKPSDYFNTVLYTGDGSASRSITGTGFQPDWVWIKNRSSSQEHRLHDAVRGANKLLRTNSNGAEATTSQDVMSFDSNGFTVGTEAAVNGSGNSLVAWNWLGANGTASNTDGSITSTVSANTTSGFSIVSYTGNSTAGATVGHGLDVAPKMLIAKNRTNGSTNWGVWHTGIPINEHLILNGTQASSVYTGFFNNTLPSTSVVTLGNDVVTNGSGNNIILYCFAEKKGFSKFGSYTGNGSTDGTFCFTGFKPAFVLIKSSSLSQDWFIHDNKRSTFNVSNTVLLPNTYDLDITDTTVYGIDMVSNGFKVRGTHARINQSGSSYIYMAFAEEPLVGDNPCTAR